MSLVSKSNVLICLKKIFKDHITVGSKYLNKRDDKDESNIQFRIDKTDNNTLVRDLKREKDIDSFKEYKKDVKKRE